MDVLEEGVHERVVDGDNEHLTRALDLGVVDVSGNVRVGTGRAWILSVQISLLIPQPRCDTIGEVAQSQLEIQT
jgi:hypothetical protein